MPLSAQLAGAQRKAIQHLLRHGVQTLVGWKMFHTSFTSSFFVLIYVYSVWFHAKYQTSATGLKPMEVQCEKDSGGLSGSCMLPFACKYRATPRIRKKSGWTSQCGQGCPKFDSLENSDPAWNHLKLIWDVWSFEMVNKKFMVYGFSNLSKTKTCCRTQSCLDSCEKVWRCRWKSENWSSWVARLEWHLNPHPSPLMAC